MFLTRRHTWTGLSDYTAKQYTVLTYLALQDQLEYIQQAKDTFVNAGLVQAVGLVGLWPYHILVGHIKELAPPLLCKAAHAHISALRSANVCVYKVDLTQDGLPQLQDLAWPTLPPIFTTMYAYMYSLCVLKVPISHEYMH